MKRTLVVLALAVLSAAGCRAIGPNGGCGCGDPCCDGCSDAAMPVANRAASHAAVSPAAAASADAAAAWKTVARRQAAARRLLCWRQLRLFDRYCGHNCGPGYGPGPYDCSPCNSPNWGCNGYRHPHGYVGGTRMLLRNEHASGRSRSTPALCGNGYCCGVCGQPAPGCCCGSGDQNYNFNPGPPVAQTAYPYYTVRGPRDFLLDNPPPLGPY